MYTEDIRTMGRRDAMLGLMESMDEALGAGDSKTPEYWRHRDKVLNIVNNQVMSRAQLMEKLMDPRRNYRAECGYLDSSRITSHLYWEMYDTFGIAERVVNVYPKETWKTNPEVYEVEEDEEGDETEFEKRWDELPKTLRGKSWAKIDGENGNPILEALCRLDIMCGIGTFGVLLIGINDGRQLDQPAAGLPADGVVFNKEAGKYVVNAEYAASPVDTDEPPNTTEGPAGSYRDIKYLKVFDESRVQIESFETNRNHPRYGQPLYYNLTYANVNDTSTQPAPGIETSTHKVHWSRVLHAIDNKTSSDIFGRSRMKGVWERLCDLREKLYPGSGEGYWRGAFPGYSVETHPQLGGDVTLNPEKIKGAMWRYMHSLQRYLAIEGAQVKSLAPQVSDPTPQINAAVDGICMSIACPIRVFKGSERGELASTQDEGNWDDRIRERQRNHAVPNLLIPFVDRLIQLGVMPEPETGEYCAHWPTPDGLTQAEKADIAVKRTQALTTFAEHGGESIMTLKRFLTSVMEYESEEAKAIVEEVEGRAEEEDRGRSPLLGTVGGIQSITQLMEAYSAGSMERDTVVQVLMLFFDLDEKRAEELVGSTEPKEEDPLAGLPGLPGLGAKKPASGAGGKPPFGGKAPLGLPAPAPKKPPV